LERIGDEAEKIARYAVQSSNLGNNTSLHVSLRHLGEYVKEMLRESLDAMARLDSPQAMRITRSDHLIDAEFEYLSRGLLTHMMEDARNIKDSMNVNWCARSLERVGDHCKNICEYVVYLVDGKDVRHTTLSKESPESTAAAGAEEEQGGAGSAPTA
ncbi:MAG: PhoU domain-containing protein, partial [Thiolinea sp.]